MNRKIMHLFKLAEAASEMSDFPRARLGCVVVYKKSVIGVGYNTTKENPMQAVYNKYRPFNNGDSVDPYQFKNTIHAEMMAISRLRKRSDIDFSKCRVVVFRKTRNGEIALAKPCPACEKAMRDLGIKKVYYTGNGSYIYEEYN